MASYQGRPAYVQVADDIRQQITDGTLQAGDRIPSEAELMEDYGVSRIVIRNAMEVVQNEGLVIKQQGRGTFVREQRPLRRMGTRRSLRQAANRLTDEARHRVRRPSF